MPKHDPTSLNQSLGERMAKSNASEIDNVSQQGNKWTRYRGTVLEDKVLDSREIKVQLEELMPLMTGDLQVIEEQKEVQDGSENGSYSGQVKATNVIKAQYLGKSTNRTFPPDVVKGEQVTVWNYADSDKYYWESDGRDDMYRKRERYRIHVAAKPNTVEELTDDNTYSLLLDSVDKIVSLKTTTADGETHQYLIKFDINANILTITDDIENAIIMESEEHRVTMRNTDGSSVVLERENVAMFAPDTVTIKGGKQIILDAPLVSEQGTRDDKVAKKKFQSMSIETADTTMIKSPCIGLDGVVNARVIVAERIISGSYNIGKL